MKRCHSPEAPEDSAPSSSKLKSIPNRDYFPSDVLKFMKQNATPRMSLKLMKLCKYFQHRTFPYLVITSFERSGGYFEYRPLRGQSVHSKNIDEIPSNLWITNRIKIFPPAKFDCEKLIDKIAVSDAKKIDFTLGNTSLKAFKHLSEKVEELFLDESYVFGKDSSTVSLDELLECLPNLMTLIVRQNCPSIVSLERANKAVSSKLKTIKFSSIDVGFNFSDFAEFMIAHQDIYYRIEIDQILTKEKMQQIQREIDKIIEAWDCQNLPPRILWLGQSDESKKALELLHHRYNEAWKVSWQQKMSMNQV